MRCAICGNAARFFHHQGVMVFIHMHQCPSCRMPLCSGRVRRGDYPEDIRKGLDEAGLQEEMATYCPRCETLIPNVAQ
ncbi:hypothetical protein [Desulfohalovibrio reitneri]|uniref:hypothetical protein n=1 Tax=Desulfohalovibrio reitneri TaxID=1307759 RepID=UPI0004A6FB1F|nr:hypothetical protein [Desulfohalovibrio reitneri]